MSTPQGPEKPKSEPLPKSLVEQVRLIEHEVAKFLELIRQERADFEKAVLTATLRSRIQAAEILNASIDQVDRWTDSGELSVVELDRRPRYRLEDLTAFAAARVRAARYSRKIAPPENSDPAKT
jgi:hypothetical protein